MKKVFLDTNILLDFITEREGVEEASSILQLGEEGQIGLTTSFLTMAMWHMLLAKDGIKQTCTN
ncbi:MAG: hypothetical protein IJ417_02000 [Bacteroidaceae bacterium]|nr:hypothetical protein [Bacteroidaceae bacterium]